MDRSLDQNFDYFEKNFAVTPRSSRVHSETRAQGEGETGSPEKASDDNSRSSASQRRLAMLRNGERLFKHAQSQPHLLMVSKPKEEPEEVNDFQSAPVTPPRPDLLSPNDCQTGLTELSMATDAVKYMSLKEIQQKKRERSKSLASNLKPEKKVESKAKVQPTPRFLERKTISLKGLGLGICHRMAPASGDTTLRLCCADRRTKTPPRTQPGLAQDRGPLRRADVDALLPGRQRDGVAQDPGRENLQAQKFNPRPQVPP